MQEYIIAVEVTGYQIQRSSNINIRILCYSWSIHFWGSRQRKLYLVL